MLTAFLNIQQQHIFRQNNIYLDGSHASLSTVSNKNAFHQRNNPMVTVDSLFCGFSPVTRTLILERHVFNVLSPTNKTPLSLILEGKRSLLVNLLYTILGYCSLSCQELDERTEVIFESHSQLVNTTLWDCRSGWSPFQSVSFW